MTHTIKIAFRSSTKELMHDHSCFSSMQICSLLLLLIFITSCNGHDKTKERVYGPKTIPTTLTEINLPVIDPYFVETQDTISTHGPHSITRNILQDKSGNYWFASWEGIVRYDGKFFTNVTLKEGLIHFHVFSVLEDKAGNLWFGTIRGGLYRYDPSASLRTGSKSFTLFTKKDGLTDNAVTCMLEDKAGNIWFGTTNGVSRYNGKTFTNFTPQEGLSGNSVNSIAQDKTGKIWFGTGGGVSFYDGKSFTDFTNILGAPFNNVRSIIEDKTGNIWIGSEDGLCRYDGKSLTNLTTNFIGYIFEDKTGKLWLSEGEVNPHDGMALYRYDGGWSFTRIIAKNSSGDNQIFGVSQDKTGNIWFGTMNGVYRYDGKSITDFTKNASNR